MKNNMHSNEKVRGEEANCSNREMARLAGTLQGGKSGEGKMMRKAQQYREKHKLSLSAKGLNSPLLPFHDT